jgi:uncharacterized protein YqjF (DUF2071 family)
MRQTWNRLLFAHWPFPVDVVRPLVPPALPLDTLDGAAWVGLVPFAMNGIQMRGLPALPGLSAFPELNLRTYVTVDGKPGVYFFTLEAANRMAVIAARRWFGLPYHLARMRCDAVAGGGTDYASERIHRGAPLAAFEAHYRPVGDTFTAAPGSPDYFFAERYCLYTAHRQGVYRGEIQHPPWRLRRAELALRTESLFAAHGLVRPAAAPHLLYAHRQDTSIWSLDRIG